MDTTREALRAAYNLLAEVLETAEFPGPLDCIARAMTDIEKAEGMYTRLNILRKYFLDHPEVNERMKEASRRGESFAFDMPKELRKKLRDTR
jgi:hypothetical protein